MLTGLWDFINAAVTVAVAFATVILLACCIHAFWLFLRMLARITHGDQKSPNDFNA